MYCSITLTFPRDESFLDICIADLRLKINTSDISLDDRNINANDAIIQGLLALPYNSDHHAILVNCSYEKGSFFELDQADKKVLWNNYQDPTETTL